VTEVKTNSPMHAIMQQHKDMWHALSEIFEHAVDREACSNKDKGDALKTIADICVQTIGPVCDECAYLKCKCEERP
jgi:hypothetical protein